MTRRWISVFLNVATAAVVFVCWGNMAFSVEGGALSAPGLYSLKYFTVLSNLLQGVASLAYAVSVARMLAHRAARVPRAVLRLKYAAAVSVSLTFLTVACFLGPLYGYRSMFSGVNFWFHLTVPLAAALDFCGLDREGAVTLRDSLWAVTPMLLYGAGYAGNILLNGLGEPGRGNDWYGFARGGLKTAPLVFAGIALATWGVALLERLPRRRR